MRTPEISLFTNASPLIFMDDGSILNESSVIISAVAEPCTGPANNSPVPVIV